MKPLYSFLLLVLGFLQTAHAQLPSPGTVFPSNCSTNARVAAQNKYDIELLTLQRSIRTGQNHSDSLFLLPAMRDTISNAFNAVFNMPASPIKDTLINLFQLNQLGLSSPVSVANDSLNIYASAGIAAATGNNPRKIRVPIYQTASFVTAWNAGQFSSSPDTFLNNLISRYRLTGTGGILSFGMQSYTFTSNLPGVNIWPLVAKFQARAGMVPQSVGILGYPGNGNTIMLSYVANGLELEFYNGCGDCPSGCQAGTIWRLLYRYSDCAVQFLSATKIGGGFHPNTCLFNTFLPLRFLSFQGNSTGSSHRLQWQVLHLGGTERMEIQRASTAGGLFETVATLAPSSATAGSVYRHSLPATTTKAYYRIKAIDQDGKHQYSDVVAIEPGAQKHLALRPSVARAGSTLYITGWQNGTADARIQLIDAQGRVLQKYNEGNVGAGQLVLPAALRPGTYYLQIQTAHSAPETLLIQVQ